MDFRNCVRCGEWVFTADLDAWPVDGGWYHGLCVPWHGLPFPFARALARGREALGRFEYAGQTVVAIDELAELVAWLVDADACWPGRDPWATVSEGMAVVRCISRWIDVAPPKLTEMRRGVPAWARVKAANDLRCRDAERGHGRP